MNPTNASQHSSRTHLTPEASLRPRNKRLVSGVDDDLDRDSNAAASVDASRAASPAASPFASRTASPIPGAGPSRSGSSQAVNRSRESTISKSALSRSQSGNAQDPLAQLSGLWGSSWTTLQGLASNVLGSDPNGDVPRKRRPFEATHGRKTTTSAPPAQWGPATRDTQVGTGTKEEREAMVRAMKRKDLLMADGHLNVDATGKFKRRNSDERISSSAPPTEHIDREALVYIHRVRPEDTLAGITIKYNCQAAPLRKANRIVTQSFKLDGPGGVGTFNRNVRKPGPAQDGLNKIFAQHLPNLAPPPGKDYFGTWNPAAMAEAKSNGNSMGPSGTATPVGVGGVGGSSSGFDLAQVGGAIEGWMRKVATQASTLVPPAQLTPSKTGVTTADRQRAAGAGLGAAGMSGDINDLIELTDAFEVGEDDKEETNRGRSGTGSGRHGPTDNVRRREARSGTPSKGAKGD
ncbi:putative carbohydrate-binding module family 50 protein [Diplodia seriata]|uniref:Putative carbohydrate-binding module family 50 protein n=1 Tax=Diplodia seriata TaxID=420778 RepID=A0A0G2EHI2_9PEZI|nr:putative carbohydrate-binding module family 50 protein [Diplodia seriata]